MLLALKTFVWRSHKMPIKYNNYRSLLDKWWIELEFQRILVCRMACFKLELLVPMEWHWNLARFRFLLQPSFANFQSEPKHMSNLIHHFVVITNKLAFLNDYNTSNSARWLELSSSRMDTPDVLVFIFIYIPRLLGVSQPVNRSSTKFSFLRMLIWRGWISYSVWLVRRRSQHNP